MLTRPGAGLAASSKEQSGSGSSVTLISSSLATSNLVSIPLGGVMASYGVVLPDGELSNVKTGSLNGVAASESKDAISGDFNCAERFFEDANTESDEDACQAPRSYMALSTWLSEAVMRVMFEGNKRYLM